MFGYRTTPRRGSRLYGCDCSWSRGRRRIASARADSNDSVHIYGNTFQGGSFGFGTIFKLNKSDTETTLFSFGTGDGAYPTQPMLRDASGNLYGVAAEGNGGSGVVFKLSPGGQETVLHSFYGGSNNNPKVPSSGLVMDKDGNLYGATLSGGDAKCDAHLSHTAEPCTNSRRTGK
jgi:uncharacterized repeat protein (TIGR03803 family)